MQELKLDSNGKVNIGLQVLDKRPDGYHNIHTIFQEIRFSDFINISKNDSDACSISCNMPEIPLDDSNICYKAYKLLKDRFDQVGGVDIRIEKSIPPGSGLGGGSANGAAVLKGLNKMFSLDLSISELEALGSVLGADVPFFMKGGTQLGEGIGEKLTNLSSPVPGYYLLVIPDLSINTGWAYGALKNSLERVKKPRNFARLLSEEIDSLAVFENDFEKIVIPAYPEIGRIKDMLYEKGARFASLSGSGSTVYGVFDEEASAKEAESSFNAHHKTVLTLPTNI